MTILIMRAYPKTLALLFATLWATAALWVVFTAHAQTADYLIRSISSALTPDQTAVSVSFDVVNNGGIMAEGVLVNLFDSGGITLATMKLPVLALNERAPITLTVPLTRFLPDTRPTLYVTVGMDTLPPTNARGQGDVAPITVIIPPAASITQPSGTPIPRLGFDLPLAVDLRDPLQLGLTVAIAGLTLILLWVISVVARQAFGRKEKFPTWQPSYPPLTVFDPNQLEGRRYLWQPHAQNDTLPVTCALGQVVTRKHVTDMGGAKFTGWRISGIRTGRYDQYGRIGRTHQLMTMRAVRRLDGIAHRQRPTTWEVAFKRVRPVSKQFVKQILKGADRRTTMLPLAMDIRFRGKGRAQVAHVTFELFRCEAQGWQLIDTWRSLPPITQGAQEQFTYSFYGQRAEEDKRAFKKRLEDDMNGVLTLLVWKVPPTPPEKEMPTVNGTPPVVDLSDTAGHTPVVPPPTTPHDAVP